MDSGERGMNPVAMTIINPRTEYWPSRGSNQRPPVLALCATDLAMKAPGMHGLMNEINEGWFLVDAFCKGW